MGVQGFSSFVEQKGDYKLYINLTQIAKTHFETQKKPLVLVVDGIGFLYYSLRVLKTDLRHGSQISESLLMRY